MGAYLHVAFCIFVPVRHASVTPWFVAVLHVLHRSGCSLQHSLALTALMLWIDWVIG
jgi:hypothetical protein